MGIDRKQIIQGLAIFTDPAAMKTRYGVTITAAQEETAKKVLKMYQTIDDAELKKIDPQTATKWPYQLTEDQRYDKLMHKAQLSMVQQIMWQSIRAYLVKHPNERKTDRESIIKSLGDLEGFLQLNTYLGNFQENEKIINATDITYLIKLFSLSYSKYLTEKQREEKYNSKQNT